MTDNNANRLTMGRRQLLQAGGAGLVAATAGCLGFFGDDGGGVPEYASYVPVTENDNGNEGAAVAYIDIAALEQLPESEQSGDGSDSDQLPQDPMLALPLSGVIGLAFIGAFSLAPLGFEGTFQDGSSDGSSSPIDEMLLSGSSIVLTGSFDTDALDERITTESEDSLRPRLEQVDERDKYTIYASTDSAQEEPTRYAISGDDIVIGTASEIEPTLDVIVGDAEPAHEAYDEFAWLLSEAGDGMMVTGGYSGEGSLSETDDGQDGSGSGTSTPALESIESANGAVGSLTSDEDGQQGTARLALSFEDLPEETRSELESAVGSDSDDTSIEFDDGRMTAEATYSEEQIQGSGGQGSES
jgi:hypothetical protein